MDDLNAKVKNLFDHYNRQLLDHQDSFEKVRELGVK